MNLNQHKINEYEQSIKDLPDRVTGQAERLKAMFDSRTDNEVKQKHNSLVEALTQSVYSKAETEVAIAQKVTDIGAGDMAAAIYDTENRRRDVFGYVDESLGRTIEGSNLTFGAAKNSIEDLVLMGETYQEGSGEPAPNNIRKINSAVTALMVGSKSYNFEAEAHMLDGSERYSSGLEKHLRSMVELTGFEEWELLPADNAVFVLRDAFGAYGTAGEVSSRCSHFLPVPQAEIVNSIHAQSMGGYESDRIMISYPAHSGNVSGFKAWLSAQRAAGTPVQVEYLRSAALEIQHAPIAVTNEVGSVQVQCISPVRVILRGKFMDKKSYDEDGMIKQSGGIAPYVKKEVQAGGITEYAHQRLGTVHLLEGDGKNICFYVEENGAYKTGDTFAVNGKAVSIKGALRFGAGELVQCILKDDTLHFEDGKAMLAVQMPVNSFAVRNMYFSTTATWPEGAKDGDILAVYT